MSTIDSSMDLGASCGPHFTSRTCSRVLASSLQTGLRHDSFRNVDANDGDYLETEQKFTAQDEQNEIAGMSIKDMVEVNTDLLGLSAGMSNLRMFDGPESKTGSGPSTDGEEVAAVAALLLALERELAALPAPSTAAYHRALAECPEQVSKERKLAHVEYENGNTSLAAQRLAFYWQVRLDTFGSDRCFLPMTLAGAMKDEAIPFASQRIWQLMPNVDQSGRAILCLFVHNRDFSKYSAEQEMRFVFYLLETLCNDADVRKHGFVMLINAQGIGRRHFSRKLKRLLEILNSTMPIRMRAFHGCYPSPIAVHLILPVVKRFQSRETRLRFKVHHGSTTKVLQELAGFGLSSDKLPVELGGDVVLDMNRWIMERLRLECSFRKGEGPVAKRPKTHIRKEYESPALAPATPAFGCSAPKASAIIIKEKGFNALSRLRRTRADPRMDRAVALKLADPDLPLYDALVSAGYVFHYGASGEVDADGISRRQRTNNLCRRIRRERGKQQASAQQKQEVSSNSTASTSVSSGRVVTLSRMDALGKGMSISPSISGGVVFSPSFDLQFIDLKAEDEAASHGSRDSFYEDILELPGIEEMKDFDFIGDEDGL